MPQMSADCLGPLLFYVESPAMDLTRQLQDFYHGASGMVAFIDESFRLDGPSRYYILGIAMVNLDQLDATRSKLLDFYGGESLHAGAMYSRGELETLRKAATLVSQQNDGLDVVVATVIATVSSSTPIKSRYSLNLIERR